MKFVGISDLFLAQDLNNMEIMRVIMRQITKEMNIDLERGVTDEKIMVAVFQLREARVPGLDGFPGLFYKRSWHTIDPDVITTVKSLLR